MNTTTEMFTNPVQMWTRFFFKTSELIWSANRAMISQVARVGTGLLPGKLKPVAVSITVPEQAVLLKSAPIKRAVTKNKAAVKSKPHAKPIRKASRSGRSKAH